MFCLLFRDEVKRQDSLPQALFYQAFVLIKSDWSGDSERENSRI